MNGYFLFITKTKKKIKMKMLVPFSTYSFVPIRPRYTLSDYYKREKEDFVVDKTKRFTCYSCEIEYINPTKQHMCVCVCVLVNMHARPF